VCNHAAGSSSYPAPREQCLIARAMKKTLHRVRPNKFELLDKKKEQTVLSFENKLTCIVVQSNKENMTPVILNDSNFVEFESNQARTSRNAESDFGLVFNSSEFSNINSSLLHSCDNKFESNSAGENFVDTSLMEINDIYMLTSSDSVQQTVTMNNEGRGHKTSPMTSPYSFQMALRSKAYPSLSNLLCTSDSSLLVDGSEENDDNDDDDGSDLEEPGDEDDVNVSFHVESDSTELQSCFHPSKCKSNQPAVISKDKVAKFTLWQKLFKGLNSKRKPCTSYKPVGL